MSASEGARPKRRIKPVYDPDFVYDLPVNPLFSDNLLESQLVACEQALSEGGKKFRRSKA